MRSLTGALRQWPRRRWITAVLAAPVLAGLLLATGRGGAWWGWPVAVLVAGLAALVVASYLPVPGSGRLLEVGCSPCAVVAAGGVAVAILARTGAPGSPATAVLAILVLLAAVRQRLADAIACPAVRRPPAGDGPGGRTG